VKVNYYTLVIFALLGASISRAADLDGGSALDVGSSPSPDAGLLSAQLANMEQGQAALDKLVSQQKPDDEPGPVPLATGFFEKLPLTIGMFGDVVGSISAADHPGFALGELDFFVTSRPHQSLHLLAEVIFKGDSTGQGAIDIERVLAEWEFDPRFRVQVGRFHQRFGYFNNAFHHGKFIMNSINRPTAVAFEDEGGVLPVHGIGIDVSGEWDLGNFTFEYSLALTNGRGRTPDEVLNLGDLNPAKSILGALVLKHIEWGAQIGVNALYDRIPALSSENQMNPPQDEVIVGAHFLLDKDIFWFLVEGYLIDHTSTSLGTARSVVLFAEARVNVNPIYIYGRFDVRRRSDVVDVFFETEGLSAEARSALLGVGYRVIPGLVLKAELEISFPRLTNLIIPTGRAQLAWSW
jgi:hypothetical protein